MFLFSNLVDFVGGVQLQRSVRLYLIQLYYHWGHLTHWLKFFEPSFGLQTHLIKIKPPVSCLLHFLYLHMTPTWSVAWWSPAPVLKCKSGRSWVGSVDVEKNIWNLLSFSSCFHLDVALYVANSDGKNYCLPRAGISPTPLFILIMAFPCSVLLFCIVCLCKSSCKSKRNLC